jgi:hypothetical protein
MLRARPLSISEGDNVGWRVKSTEIGRDAAELLPFVEPGDIEHPLKIRRRQPDNRMNFKGALNCAPG